MTSVDKWWRHVIFSPGSREPGSPILFSEESWYVTPLRAPLLKEAPSHHVLVLFQISVCQYSLDMRLSRSLIALLWAIPIAQAVADTPPSSAGPRVFSLTLTWEKHAPDGFEREMVLVNGQFPGPLLEINQGDSVEVKVQNNLPFNTTVHFHGTILGRDCGTELTVLS